MKNYTLTIVLLIVQFTAFGQEDRSSKSHLKLVKIEPMVHKSPQLDLGRKKRIPMPSKASSQQKSRTIRNNQIKSVAHFNQSTVQNRTRGVVQTQIIPKSMHLTPIATSKNGTAPKQEISTKGNHTQDGLKDSRNLQISQNGKLLSVDGYEVDFKVPIIPSIAHLANKCGTPSGKMNLVSGGTNSRSAGCPFTVACDDPSNRDAAPTTAKYFQLKWHVMQSTGGGASSNIDQARIDALMAELNADFTTENLNFCADPASFYQDDVNYTHDFTTEEVSMKTTYNVTPAEVINIYVVGSMDKAGYGRFPYDPTGGTSTTGGIVLNKDYCIIGSHTLTHEMGHTFGLEHTYAGVEERIACSPCYEEVRNVNGSSNTSGLATPFLGPYNSEGDKEGDWCSDTHPHDINAYNCSTSSNANNAGCDLFPWANAPVNNHMSFSFCSSEFTSQQNSRMHCMIATYLNGWTSSAGIACSSDLPVADFIGNPTAWTVPATVNFTDNSTPQSQITSYTWVFDVAASGTVTCAGCTGANATFVGQVPPTVTYSTIGLYTTSLTVTSVNGPTTETKNNYIEVRAPIGDCQELSLYWDNPVSTASTYGGFAAGEHILLLPDQSNSPGIAAKGAYERYLTPNPGITKVGAVSIGLNGLNDPDDDMIIQVTVYDDNGSGAPGALLGVSNTYSPTQLGVSTGATFSIHKIPLPAVIPTTATFHVGIEVLPGDVTDALVLIASANGEGQGNGLNHIFSTGFGFDNLLTAFALDVDLYLIPELGETTPETQITGLVENVVCDTTYVSISNTVNYSSVSSITYTFADGTTINSSTVIPTLERTYTVAGPDELTIITLNDCGRSDTTSWTINYKFSPSPDPAFTKAQPNPICTGATGVDFTANTSGHKDYTWDFGDGTPLFSSGYTNATNHIYTVPSTEYTSLTVTALSIDPTDILHFEDFTAGWPAGYARFNNDVFTPNASINPPFTGANATAWLTFDVTGDGNATAVSTSYNAPGQQADDWMITSAIVIPDGNQMLSWKANTEDPTFRDGYEVRLSTTAQAPANTTNFSTVLFSTAAENRAVTRRSINLAAYSGQTVYIAFRNNSTDKYLLSIDDIWVGTSGTGCTATRTINDFIEVIDCAVTAPTAKLDTSSTLGCGTLIVSFADSTKVGDLATSWTWNFGDGAFSTLQHPTHAFAAPGTYDVIFEACNTGGCTRDIIQIVAAAPVVVTSPTIIPLPAGTFCPNTTVNLTSSGGTAGVGTTVKWYSGPNGTGNALGDGNNINIVTDTTATYYVRREGDICGPTDDSSIVVNVKHYGYAVDGTSSNNYCTDNDGWNHFFDGNEIIFSIDGDITTGAVIGFPLVTISEATNFYQATEGPSTPPFCSVGNAPGEERFEMKRSWNVDLGGGSVNAPYNLRFLYEPTDRVAIETAAASHIATYPSCGYVYKYPTTLGFYWFKNTGSNYSAPDYDGLQLNGVNGTTSNGLTYTELTGITSFSGGSGAVVLSPSSALSIDQKELKGTVNEQRLEVSWSVNPNPVTNNSQVTITSDKEEQAIISVYNLLGELLVENKVTLVMGKTEFAFPHVEHRSNGIYFLTLKTKGTLLKIKVLKSN